MPGRNAVIEKNDFAAVAQNVRGALAQGVRDVTLDLLQKSVALAPVEEGILRGSASAHHEGERIATGADVDARAKGGQAASGGQGTDGEGRLGVVMYNAIYAAAQHEQTDQVHPSGGQAKYLEQPLAQNRAAYQKRLADAVRQELAG